jgi:hypothetical protein
VLQPVLIIAIAGYHRQYAFSGCSYRVTDAMLRIQTIQEHNSKRNISITQSLIETIEIDRNQAINHYKFAEVKAEYYASNWRPRGDLNP